MSRPSSLRLAAAALLTGSAAWAMPQSPARPNYRELERAIEASLWHEHAEPFLSHVPDPAGGFYQRFDRKWTRLPEEGRFVVYQARAVWTAATLAEFDPEKAPGAKKLAIDGAKYLRQTFWDPEFGGFYWNLGNDGKPDDALHGEKHLYGNAFALYGLAAAARVSSSPEILGWTKEAFEWMESHVADSEHGGYFESATREGTPRLRAEPAEGAALVDLLGTPLGFRSQNSHLHLMEALTELARVWPDPRVAARLDECLRILTTDMFVEPGCLHVMFTPDWRPVPALTSIGHNVEAGYLAVEAARVLGRPDDERVWSFAKSVVDHALAVGWDEEFGGLVSGAEAFGPVYNFAKSWWTQAEALNALAMILERYGEESPAYGAAFERQWNWIVAHQIDHEFLGWFGELDREGRPRGNGEKADRWKCVYHDGRALVNVVKTLRRWNEKVGGKGLEPPTSSV